ncbi:MAG TPA: matrixin family metalloprotease, partial [Mycobacteriales bacterium]|nr:matrixin family metalloprotease [Mycobacteriales bacterium]
AARRALSRWALASSIQFVVTTDDPRQDVNLPGTSDGVSLITIADTPTNRTFFGGQPSQRPGRANVIFDNNGNINEADAAVNPLVTRFDPTTGQQTASFFSTDGTPGSYDLESTLTHEIGHTLGLEHSGLVSATMQPRQGTNGTFDLPNFTTRTLSGDDVAAVRSIYGPRSGLGAVAGRALFVGGNPAFGAHVFAEDTATGRVVAGNVALPDGRYRIDSLPPGQYRLVAERLDEPVSADQIASNAGGYAGLSLSNTAPFLTTEAGTASVAADSATSFDVTVTGGTTPFNPQFIGTGASGQLSTVAVPVVPGTPMTVLMGGDNLGVIPANGVSVTSPFITVSNVQQIAGFGIPVISFDITPSVLTPPGEYSVRLQSSAGQIAYISGGLTVDLPNGVPATGPNLIDNTQFFVAQHYRDFL